MTGLAEHRWSAYAGTPVLIVEDDPLVRTLLRLTLEVEGYHVVSAADGAEALREIHRTHPCSVVLDLDLPIGCGEQIAAEMRAGQGAVGGVLIGISAASDGRRRADAVGVNGYFSKPFDVDALVSRLAEALSALSPVEAR